MARLTRAEAQERNRSKVLAAARAEFIARGYREAKVDAIAERADLTRGAVYSNFPGKRALYLAVLAEDAVRRSREVRPDAAPTSPREALGGFARAWVARLPLATDQRHDAARLGAELWPEVLADERLRRPFTQLMKLEAILLGLSLESLERLAPQEGTRRVRVAEAALTTLAGATQLAAVAPGFVEPFDLIRACEQLADLDLGDRWSPHGIVPTVRPADGSWSPPKVVTDALRDEPVRPDGDGPRHGVVAVLGLHRASALEEAVRSAPDGLEVTAALVTGDPAELGPLATLALADLRSGLRQAFPPSALPPLRLVLDLDAALAAAAGVDAVSDATEHAIRIENGRVTGRADGFGACHAVASALTDRPASTRRERRP